MTLTVNEKHLALDVNGHLGHFEDWTPVVAEVLAQQESIELTQAHWEIIELAQQFYNQFDLSPSMRPFVNFVKKQLGPTQGNSIYLMRLFSSSPVVSISRISGLPRPKHCL